MGLRSPKARNDLRMLKAHQKMQSERLAFPKQRSVEKFASLEATHSKKFLQSMNRFSMHEDIAGAL